MVSMAWVWSLAGSHGLESGIAKTVASVTSMAWIQSLVRGLPYATGTAEKEKKFFLRKNKLRLCLWYFPGKKNYVSKTSCYMNGLIIINVLRYIIRPCFPPLVSSLFFFFRWDLGKLTQQVLENIFAGLWNPGNSENLASVINASVVQGSERCLLLNLVLLWFKSASTCNVNSFYSLSYYPQHLS